MKVGDHEIKMLMERDPAVCPGRTSTSTSSSSPPASSETVPSRSTSMPARSGSS